MRIFMRKNKTLFATILLILACPSGLHSMEQESKKSAVFLVSDDGSGKEFDLPPSAAKHSELIKNMLSDINQEHKLPVAVDSESLERIVLALKKLDTVPHETVTPEYNQALEKEVKPLLIGSTIDDNLKILEIVNRFNTPSLIRLLIDAIERQLHVCKDLNYIEKILEKINITVKDFKPAFKNQLQRSNKSLFFHLFFTYLQSSVGLNSDAPSNSFFEDIKDWHLVINADLKEALVSYVNNQIKICHFNSSERPVIKQFFLPPALDKSRLWTSGHRTGTIALSPNCQYAFVSTYDPNNGYLLDVTGSTISILKHFYLNLDRLSLYSAGFSLDSSILLLGTTVGQVYIYHMKDLKQGPLIIPSDYLSSYKLMHPTRIASVAITADNIYFFAGYSINHHPRASIVEMRESASIKAEAKPLKILKAESREITFIAISDDVKVALTKSIRGGAYLYDLTKTENELVPTFVLATEKKNESFHVKALALDHEGKMALTFSHKQKLTLWNLEDLTKCVPYFTIQMPKTSVVYEVAFDKHNQPVALVSDNGKPRWCSFSDFMAKFSLPELILLTKIEQYKADNKLNEINECAYFRELYAKWSLEIKTLVDQFFGINLSK